MRATSLTADPMTVKSRRSGTDIAIQHVAQMQRQIHSSNPLPHGVAHSVHLVDRRHRFGRRSERLAADFLRPLAVEREDCQHANAQELLDQGAARTQGNCQCLKHIVQQLDDCQRLACRQRLV